MRAVLLSTMAVSVVVLVVANHGNGVQVDAFAQCDAVRVRPRHRESRSPSRSWKVVLPSGTYPALWKDLNKYATDGVQTLRPHNP